MERNFKIKIERNCFLFDFEPNEKKFGSISKGELTLGPHSIAFEREWDLCSAETSQKGAEKVQFGANVHPTSVPQAGMLFCLNIPLLNVYIYICMYICVCMHASVC